MGVNLTTLANHSIDTSKGGNSILLQLEERLSSNIYRRTVKDENYWPVGRWTTALLKNSTCDWAADADEAWNDSKDFRIWRTAGDDQPEYDFNLYPHIASVDVADWNDWRHFAVAFLLSAETAFEMNYRKKTAEFIKKLGGTSAIHISGDLMNQLFDWDYNDTLDTFLSKAKTREIVIWDIAAKKLLHGSIPSKEYNDYHRYQHFLFIDNFSNL